MSTSDLDLISIQDIWCEKSHTITPKSIPHHRYSTDKEGPGQHIKIGQFLGNGTFGRVYEAKNLKTNQDHAIKIAEKPSVSTLARLRALPYI
jgi:hypothetical protein